VITGLQQGGAMELLEPQMACSTQTTCSTPPCAAFFVARRRAHAPAETVASVVYYQTLTAFF
ncbi:hypothetical protein, partial [Xanthomonas axonopodis]|uniref:hypothetical protein n=1 Tax=Xanthomonas axonopodis TaxID=53413 RepID=UPI001C280E61